MASHSSPRILALTAGADLSAKQHRFMKFGASDELVTFSAAGTNSHIGVLMNAPISGDQAEIAQPGGGAKIKLAATLARGAVVTSDANGDAVAPAAGDRLGAVLMESGIAGDVVACEPVHGLYAVT